jgi:N-acetylglucosamine-6-phosphate deacetylase
MQQFTGASLGTAVQCASYNPASLLGVTDAVSDIGPGKPANFNIFEVAGKMTGTILNGIRV